MKFVFHVIENTRRRPDANGRGNVLFIWGISIGVGERCCGRLLTWPGLLRHWADMMARLDCRTVPPEGVSMVTPCFSDPGVQRVSE